MLEKIVGMLEEHSPSKTIAAAPFADQPVLAMFEGALYRATVLEVSLNVNVLIKYLHFIRLESG